MRAQTGVWVQVKPSDNLPGYRPDRGDCSCQLDRPLAALASQAGINKQAHPPSSNWVKAAWLLIATRFMSSPRKREGTAIRLLQPPWLFIGSSRGCLKNAQEHLPGQLSRLRILVGRMIGSQQRFAIRHSVPGAMPKDVGFLT